MPRRSPLLPALLGLLSSVAWTGVAWPRQPAILLRAVASAQSSGRPASNAGALTEHQIQGLVAGGVDSRRLALLVDSRGIDFTPTSRFLAGLKAAGAEDVLIQALSKAAPVKPTSEAKRAAGTAAGTQGPAGNRTSSMAPPSIAPPANPTPGAVSPAANETPAPPVHSPEFEQQLDQTLGRGADLNERQHWAEAEQAYRAGLKLDPNVPAAHFGLATALSGQKKWDDAIAEYREMLRLDPNNTMAHRGLGLALAEKHDWTGAIAEDGEALLRNPADAELDAKLGDAFKAKGDLDGAIKAYQAAVQLTPDDAERQKRLAGVLYAASDLDGAIAAYRQVVRLSPRDARAHQDLGDALLNKGDRRGALEEYHRAFELQPDNSTLGSSYAAILKSLGPP